MHIDIDLPKKEWDSIVQLLGKIEDKSAARLKSQIERELLLWGWCYDNPYVEHNETEMKKWQK